MYEKGKARLGYVYASPLVTGGRKKESMELLDTAEVRLSPTELKINNSAAAERVVAVEFIHRVNCQRVAFDVLGCTRESITTELIAFRMYCPATELAMRVVSSSDDELPCVHV